MAEARIHRPQYKRTAGRGQCAWLAAAALALAGCASAGLEAEVPPAPIPVVLEAAPRHILVAPQTLGVSLWDRPGGPAGRAVRVAAVPSGTAAVMVAYAPASPWSQLRDGLGLSNLGREPVEWVKVSTPLAEGWVRKEFTRPR